MQMIEIINKKKIGQELTKEEIEFFLTGNLRGEIPDYQVSALLMAIYFQGMSSHETSDLTMAMSQSGDQLDLSAIGEIVVDKHSSGGVGDKTTLILAPLVAACGVPVAKMSGRGLGHTGGTIDKLESIPGYQSELAEDKFIEIVRRDGLAIIGQTANLTPGDKALYALRDVTGTVDSIPLIASSIMSKKIAAGANKIVLDVKYGRGAFMQTASQAEILAQTMVNIGKSLSRETVAIISNMNQPLGYEIGNANEIREVIASLSGRGPADLMELSLALAGQMLILAGRVASEDEARDLLSSKLEDGTALRCFHKFLINQGVDGVIIDRLEASLPRPKHEEKVISQAAGYVVSIDALAIGQLVLGLGAGRFNKDTIIDPSVGLSLNIKVGNKLERGQEIAVIYAKSPEDARQASRELLDAIEIGSEKISREGLIYKIIR